MKYKRWKKQKLTTNQIIQKASSTNIILSIFFQPAPTPMDIDIQPLYCDESPIINVSSIVDSYPTTSVMIDEKPPTAKRSRRPQVFSTSFSRSYKDFNDLVDKQKKMITQALIDMMINFLNVNQFSISLADILLYLRSREKVQKD